MIPLLFNLLFFALPLIFLPFTSELFEFNKMVMIYSATALIAGAWTMQMIKQKRILFRRTILDIPLLLFLFSQIIATIFSIDRYTSFFGYYSRFNGGLVSTFCYVILYWVYVSSITKTQATKHIKMLIVSATIVAIWGALEHFGVSPSCIIITGRANADCWVQDVQNRVFATLGQPNWMAAFLVAVMPLLWATGLHIPLLFLFSALIFTKSRSGLLGFSASYALYWLLTQKWKKFLFITLYLGVAAALLVFLPNSKVASTVQGPALETGGTESGTLRQIVWQGAIDIWRNHPIVGTGVETFAYSYYQFRPAAHNLTSEWDFIYNKAHNEYLNLAATTGILGLGSYLFLIVSVIFLFFKTKQYALLAGFVSICITNFFGFSVSITSLLFFVFPAMGIALNSETKTKKKIPNLSSQQKLGLGLAVLVTSLVILCIGKYWLADYYFAIGRKANDAGKIAEASNAFSRAIGLNPAVALYYDALSYTYTQASNAPAAIEQSAQARALSPRNVTLAKSRANMFLDLAQKDKNYLDSAKDTLEDLKKWAPTDPSIYYRLGLVQINSGETDEAIKNIEEAIKLKPNYKNARMALFYIYKQVGQRESAKQQLEYILSNISPDDELAKNELEKLQK